MQDCRFRQAYEKWQGGENQRREENPANPREAGSKDLRSYMGKNETLERGKVCAAYIDPQFVFAVLRGDLDDVAEGDGEKAQQNKWGKKFQHLLLVTPLLYK